jgi:glycosyltransferase involved in cell wall biosynthesis
MTALARPLRVAWLSTAARDDAGSMRAYAQTLVEALGRHAPEIEGELVELDPVAAGGRWRRRADTLLLPLRARRRRTLAPDLWHVLDGSRAHLASALGGAPVVITVHDLIPWLQGGPRLPQVARAGWASRWLWRRNGRAMRRARSLVCDSASTARDVAHAFGVPPGACRVARLPLRPALAALLGPAPHAAPDRVEGIVLHVGNNAFYKGRDQVLRIGAVLDPTLARRIVLLGPPPTPALRELAQQLGIAARVEWVVDPDDRALASWYRAASVLVYPSRYEGFGWPVLEAMAFGLPVVVSDRGSLPEVVADAAPVVAGDDVAGFATAAEPLLRSPALARAAAARGLERAAAFSLPAFAKVMRDAYVGALDARVLAVAG